MNTMQTAETAKVRQIVENMPYNDVELLRLIGHVGDVDLAIDALLMRPRPSWLHQVATERPVTV